MANKKIGAFTLKEHAADKPTSIDTQGNLVFPQDVAENKAKSLTSLVTLDDGLKVKLAVERIKVEPDFKLGIINIGSFTKKEVLQNIEDQTELGQELTLAEMIYCQEFNAQLANSRFKLPVDVSVKPVVTKIPKDWQWLPNKYLHQVKARALFLEDTTDNLTNLAATWRKANVHPFFAAQGFEVKVLEGVYDVGYYAAIESKHNRVVYISGVGHGSGTTYTGHLGNPVLKVGSYDAVQVKDKHIHLLSCQTAKSLGPDFIAKGATSYFGYFENFVFNFDVANTPVNELNLFWLADSQIDFSLASGRTVAQAHADAIAKFNWAIAQVPNTGIATNLTTDRNILRNAVLGATWGTKPNATVPKFVFESLFVTA